MAFQVTPTSGAGPFTYTAQLANTLGLDVGLYVAEVRALTSVGACPSDVLSAPNNENFANALVNNGTNVSSIEVPSGSCRRTTFLLRRLSDNEIVSQLSVNIDNV